MRSFFEIRWILSIPFICCILLFLSCKIASLPATTAKVDTLIQVSAQPPRTIGGFYIVINKSEYTLTLFRDTTVVKVYPCAVGKNKGDKLRRWDYCTPEGNFYVESIEKSSSWAHDFRGDGKGLIRGAYGPWFFRLHTGSETTNTGLSWTGYAIHGTHDPSSIGKNASEGCIRLKNEDILDIKQFIQVGIPVRIE